MCPLWKGLYSQIIPLIFILLPLRSNFNLFCTFFSNFTIYDKLNIEINYKPFTSFNFRCRETIGNCLYTLYNSNSFEDAIRKTIALGGDTDTNACIVGSMAEAMYGIDDTLIKQANQKIPEEFVKVLSRTRRIYD